MKKALHCSLIFLSVMILLAHPSRVRGQWRDVSPADSVSLPRDLFFQKDHRIQWWYLTGHLFDGSGREFGYELTFFAAGVQQRKYRSRFGVDFIYLSHFAVSDISGKRFYHFGDADSGAYGFAGADESRLHVWVDQSFLEGTAAGMHVSARGGDVAIDLSLTPEKKAALHGAQGYSCKSETSPLIASRYFSFTDLQTDGRVTLAGESYPVSGKSWFDREISSRGLAGNEAGWDWFSLQLDDGREIMLYEIRNQDGTPDSCSSGTVVYRDGTSRHLKQKDFHVRVLDHYTSPHTAIRYPAKWEVTVPSEKLDLLVVPLLQDQEFIEGGAIRKTYWEGTCGVEGPVRGRAYVELTGY